MKITCIFSVVLGLAVLSVAKPRKALSSACATEFRTMQMAHHHNFHKPQCLNQNLNISDMVKESVMKCHNMTMNTANGRNPPTQSQRACDIVCGAQGIGMLDKNGKPELKAKVEELVMQIFPKDAAPKIAEALSTCSDKHGKNLVMKENDCGSYTPLIECIIVSTRQICGLQQQLF